MFAQGQGEGGLGGEEAPGQGGVSEVLFHSCFRKMTNNHPIPLLQHRMQYPSQNRPIIRQMRNTSLFLKDAGEGLVVDVLVHFGGEVEEAEGGWVLVLDKFELE